MSVCVCVCVCVCMCVCVCVCKEKGGRQWQGRPVDVCGTLLRTLLLEALFIKQACYLFIFIHLVII